MVVLRAPEPAEPRPPDPAWPRYTALPLPPRRFVPGVTTRPDESLADGVLGWNGATPPPWSPSAWHNLTAYLYAIDLYNYACWWECHEVLEGLWHAAGRRGAPAEFVQGLIHLAAANLNRHRGKPRAARQAERGLERLQQAAGDAPVYMGIDVAKLVPRVRAAFAEDPFRPAWIRLELGA